MKTNRRRVLVFVLSIGIAGILACKEKVPYPEPVVTPGSALPEDEPLAPTAVLPRGVLPVEGGEAGDAGIGPARPTALIGTPEGSFLVSAATGGRDLKVRRSAGIVRMLADGDARVLGMESTPLKGPSGATRPSVAMSLRLQGGGRNEVILQASTERVDLVALGAGDPDLAAEYYHVETMIPVGLLGENVTFLAGVSSYLGGAHPSATMALRTVDIRDGRLVRTEGLGDAEQVTGQRGDPCLSSPAGVVGVEGTGGIPIQVAGFSHEYEVCSGDFRLVATSQPGETAGSVPAGRPAFLKDGALHLLGGGRSFPGVVDWRASDDGRTIVMLMGQGRGDRKVHPWDVKRLRDFAARSREIRYWAEGMTDPAVLGRASRLLFVQFPGESDDTHRLVRAFDDR